MSDKSCYGCILYAMCMIRDKIDTAMKESSVLIYSQTVCKRIFEELARECPHHDVHPEDKPEEEKCDHPEDMRIDYHDNSILCKKCNKVIAQYGKFFG